MFYLTAPLSRSGSAISAEYRRFSLPSSHLALSFGVTTFEFIESFTVPKTRVLQAADVEDLVILACTVFDWSTRVTDGQTDGQNCDGLRSFKVINISKKLVASACYDKQHVCAYLQPFSR